MKNFKLVTIPIIAICVIAIGAFTFFVADAATNTASGGTFANENSVGSVSWGNTANAGASDNSYATALMSGSDTTRYIQATNFGFSIPGGATINGIEFNVERNSDDTITDSSIRIVKGGTITGDNKSAGATWSGGDAVATFGGAADKWGTTWTADDINSSTFGVVISASEGTGDSNTARIDHMEITIHYTEASEQINIKAENINIKAGSLDIR